MLDKTPRRALLGFLLLSTALSACGDDASASDASTADASTADASTADASMADADTTDGSAPADAAIDAPAADTWTRFAQGFFSDYCVGCHSGSPRDYRTMTDVLRDSSEIACGVSPDARASCTGFPAPGQFPVGTGAHPSDGERLRLVAWIDAGLPE